MLDSLLLILNRETVAVAAQCEMIQQSRKELEQAWQTKFFKILDHLVCVMCDDAEAVKSRVGYMKSFMEMEYVTHSTEDNNRQARCRQRLNTIYDDAIEMCAYSPGVTGLMMADRYTQEFFAGVGAINYYAALIGEDITTVLSQ